MTFEINHGVFLKNKYHIFLDHVAHGEEHLAKEMLKKDITLLLKKDKVEDYSGRKFQNISAFQYAVWAQDWRMWQMMFDSLQIAACTQSFYKTAEKIRKKLLEQYLEVQEAGVTYTFNDAEHKGEKHFSFDPIINALTVYHQQFNNWTKSQRIAYWCGEIGRIQRLFPAHVAHEYCLGLFKNPSFKELNFPRSFRFRNWEYSTGQGAQWVSWFPRSTHNKIGNAIAISAHGGFAWVVSAHEELNALTRLSKVRAKDTRTLKTILSSPLPKLYEIKTEQLPSGQNVITSYV